MPPINLRVSPSDNISYFQAIAEIDSSDDLAHSWRVCTKVKDVLEHGNRLENLSWRLWHLHSKMVASKQMPMDDFKKISQDKARQVEIGTCTELAALPNTKKALENGLAVKKRPENIKTEPVQALSQSSEPMPVLEQVVTPSESNGSTTPTEIEFPSPSAFQELLECTSLFDPLPVSSCLLEDYSDLLTDQVVNDPKPQSALDNIIKSDTRSAIIKSDTRSATYSAYQTFDPFMTFDATANSQSFWFTQFPFSQFSTGSILQESVPLNAIKPQQTLEKSTELCCNNCGVTSTPLWRRSANEELLCNACGLYQKTHQQSRPNSLSQSTTARKESTGTTVCSNCSTMNTPLWRKDELNRMLCNACGLYRKLHNQDRPLSMKSDVIRKRQRLDSDSRKRKL